MSAKCINVNVNVLHLDLDTCLDTINDYVLSLYVFCLIVLLL